uniref:hypothetical protein n=1 Tax=Candidatus Onthocola sp. TaxID=3085646 RepID=UPI003FEF2C0C
MNERIVTTKMPDCRKYKSVLIIKDEKEFIEKLQEALKLKNNNQANAIINLIKKDE